MYAAGLAEEGASVAVCDIQDPQPVVDRLVAEGWRVIGGIVDVTDAKSIVAFVERTNRELSGVDVLVNNAALFGVLAHRRFLEIPSEEWERVMSVNTRGVFEFSKAVVPFMRARGGGKIINITSSTIYFGSPMLMHYVASKGAVDAMTRVMARELGEDNIAVNSLAPGLTMSEAVAARPVKAMAERAVQGRAFKREQLPADLIGPLVYLASDDSNFVTGQAHVVDGGGTMR